MMAIPQVMASTTPTYPSAENPRCKWHRRLHQPGEKKEQLGLVDSPVQNLPGLVNVNRKLLKMAICSGFTHEK